MLNWYKNHRGKMAEVLFWVSIFGAILNAADAMMFRSIINVVFALMEFFASAYWLFVVLDEL